jgi:flagellin-like protein
MKAISPMIAVVLLIAFTVSVGGILSVWLSTLSTTQTTIVSSGTEKQVRCGASSLIIKEVRYNATQPCTLCNISHYVNTTIRYESGAEVLSPNVTFEVISRGTRNISTHVVTLDPGESYTNSTNATTQGAAAGGVILAIPPELVRVRTFCQTNIPITAECKSGQPCMIPSS